MSGLLKSSPSRPICYCKSSYVFLGVFLCPVFPSHQRPLGAQETLFVNWDVLSLWKNAPNFRKLHQNIENLTWWFKSGFLFLIKFIPWFWLIIDPIGRCTNIAQNSTCWNIQILIFVCTISDLLGECQKIVGQEQMYSLETFGLQKYSSSQNEMEWRYCEMRWRRMEEMDSETKQVAENECYTQQWVNLA